MNKKSFFIAAIAMFLASHGAAAAESGNYPLTAASPRALASTVTSTGIACTDSDNGLDYFVKGSVQDANRPGLFKTYDKCVSDTRLLEYACKDNSWHASYFDCQYGCSDGACLKGNQAAPAASQITDREIDDFIKGYVGNAEVGNVDLAEINISINSDNMTDEEIRNYLEDYLMGIDFNNAAINDEEDLQDFLIDYFAGLQRNGSGSVNLPDGTLVRLPDDEKVYVVKDGMKEWIETAEKFVREGYDWNAIQEVDKRTLGNIQDQVRLIKDENNKVYEVIGDKAMWIPNEKAFAAEGLDWNNVESIGGNIENTYQLVNVVADDNGNFYQITQNGQKQLVMNQDALRSVAGARDTSAVEASLEEIMNDYMERILAAAEGMDENSDPSEVIGLSAQMAEELTQVTDELVGQISESVREAIGSGGTASDGIDGTDWDAVLEDIMSRFDSESMDGMTGRDIESGMKSTWRQFKAEYSGGSYSSTVTGTGTGDTWEEAWQNLLDNLQTETSSAGSGSDGKIAEELEEAWGQFESLFGGNGDMSDWEDFLNGYDYSSDLEDLMSRFEESGSFVDLDALLSQNENLLNAGGIADSLIESGISGDDLAGIFDMMSQKTGKDFSGLSQLISTLSDNCTDNDIASIMDFVSGMTDSDMSGLGSLVSSLSGASRSDMSDLSSMFSQMGSGSGNVDIDGIMSAVSGLNGSSSDAGSVMDMVSGLTGRDFSGISSLISGLSGASRSDINDIGSLLGGMTGSDASGLGSLLGGMDSSNMSGLGSMMSGLGGSDMSDLSSLLGGFSGMGGLDSMLGSMSLAKSDKFLKSIDDVSLVREEGDYKVYDISSGYKKWIPTAEEFDARGYSWSNIVVVPSKVFEAYSASR